MVLCLGFRKLRSNFPQDIYKQEHMGTDLTQTISNFPKFAAVLIHQNIILLSAEQILHF
jgi:hypothetical protein